MPVARHPLAHTLAPLLLSLGVAACAADHLPTGPAPDAAPWRGPAAASHVDDYPFAVVEITVPVLPGLTLHGRSMVGAEVTALVSADLVQVGGTGQGCGAADYAGFPAGAVALGRRGGCTFRQKLDNAASAGAVALVVVNGPDATTGANSGELVISASAAGEVPPSIPGVIVGYGTGQLLHVPSGNPTVTLQPVPPPTGHVPDYLFPVTEVVIAGVATPVFAGRAVEGGPTGTAARIMAAQWLVNIGGCEAAQWAGFPLNAIALVERGGCTYAQKLANAVAAGASALIVHNADTPTQGERLTQPLVGEGAAVPIPLLLVGHAAGTALTTRGSGAVLTLRPLAALVEADVDVMPDSDVNQISGRPGSYGVIPVAILGSATLDVTLIDAASARLGADAAALPFQGVAIATRPNGTPHASIGDVNRDRIPDLVLHFTRTDLLDAGQLGPDVTALTVAASLTDGGRVYGSDAVRVKN